ncbi:acyl-CoA N-acyltransferase [Atractiella rhizophila]|nr:acyl-CoA N-acyltransferase [Atractiella rhizophila]
MAAAQSMETNLQTSSNPESHLHHCINTVFYCSYIFFTWYPSPFPFQEEDIVLAKEYSSKTGGANSSRAQTQKASALHSASTTAGTRGSAAETDATVSVPEEPLSHDGDGKSVSKGSVRVNTGGTRMSREMRALSGGVVSQVPQVTRGGAFEPTIDKLFVCGGCFAYFTLPSQYSAHRKSCNHMHPPGKKVYQNGAHIIWEVDGAVNKLYCQCLCLFGKLFIDHKYVFFDVEGFKFYILTESIGSCDWPLGYFSKEKESYDNYNLACIVIFPPFQGRSYGTMLIEFSYELSKRQPGVAGTPERPLSELGLRAYLAFWSTEVLEFLRTTLANEGFSGKLASLPQKAASKRSKKVTPLTQEARPEPESFETTFTIEGIGKALGLRPDDVAMALEASGLSCWRNNQGSMQEVVITLELLNDKIRGHKVKRLLESSCLLLDN